MELSSRTNLAQGGCAVNIDVECSGFFGNMLGTGALYVKGRPNNGFVRVEGVGGYELLCSNMDVTVSGIGSAKVYASKVLTATLNGVGSIKYKGDPETKNFDTNGIGSIKKVTD